MNPSLPGLHPVSPIDANAPLFALGFRPFYLLAAIFAAGAVPVWLLSYTGNTATPAVNFLWHMHEMVFGFGMAVVAGFLLTAVQTWTGLATPKRRRLQVLVLLWLAGRFAAFCPSGLVYLVVDTAFPVTVTACILRLLLQANNRRNLPICGILGLLSVADIAFHAARLGWIELSPIVPIHASLLLLTILTSIIGGRVIPMFTRNGVPSSKPYQFIWLDRMCLASISTGCLVWLFAPHAWTSAALLAAAASLHTARLLIWDPVESRRNPLVWALHLSYLMLVAGLFCLAGSVLNFCSTSTAFHLLGVGGVSGMICAMITRTAMGHTGRPLRAGTAEVAIYLLISTTSFLRVAANVIGSPRLLLLTGAAVAWTAAFTVYILRYRPYLFKPRVDGRAG